MRVGAPQQLFLRGADGHHRRRGQPRTQRLQLGVHVLGRDHRHHRADAVGTLRVDQPRGQQHLAGQRLPEDRGAPVDDERRERVAQRPGDRVSEPRPRGGDPQVAVGGHRQPAADADPLHGGDGHLRQLGDRAQHLADLGLVGHAVLAAGQRGELRDLVAGREGASAGAAEDDEAYVGVGLQLGAQLEQSFVRRAGERVVPLGPVEDHLHGVLAAADEERPVGQLSFACVVAFPVVLAHGRQPRRHGAPAPFWTALAEGGQRLPGIAVPGLGRWW